MKNKYRELILNTAIFALGSLGEKIILFFFLPFYTNVLTTNEYGTAELITTFSALLVPLFSCSISDAVLRFGLDKENRPSSVIQNAILVCLWGIVFLICCIPLLKSYVIISNYVYFIVILSGLMIFRQIFQLFAKSINCNKLYAIESIVNTFFLAFFNVIFLVYFKYGVEGYLYSLLLSTFLSLLVLLYTLRAHLVSCFEYFDKDLCKKMLKYSLPMILNAMSWWLIHSTDKIMIQSYLGSSAVGIYTVSSKIPSLVNSVTYFFSQAWIIAAITEYDTSRDANFYSKTFRLFNFGLCLSVFLLISIIKYFMAIYVGASFLSSWEYAPLLLVAAVFRNYSDYFGAFFSSAKKNIYLVITTALGAATNIIANYLLIPLYGVQGAVIGTFLAFFVIGFARLYGSRSILVFPIRWNGVIMMILVLLFQSLLVILDKQMFVYSLIGIFIILLLHVDVIRIIYSGLLKTNYLLWRKK